MTTTDVVLFLGGVLFASSIFSAIVALVAYSLVRLYAGEAAIPAAFKILREGCFSVSDVALTPTPRTGRVSLRLPRHLGGHVLFSAERVVTSEKLWRIMLLGKFDVAVHGAVVDAGLDEGTLVPHFGRFLLWSGLAVMPEEGGGGGEEEQRGEGGERAVGGERGEGGEGAVGEGREGFEAAWLRKRNGREKARRKSGVAKRSLFGAGAAGEAFDGRGEVEGGKFVSSFAAEEAPVVSAAAGASRPSAARRRSPPPPSTSTLPPPIAVPLAARVRAGPATIHVGRGSLMILEAAAEVLVGERRRRDGRGGGGEPSFPTPSESNDGVVSVVVAAGASALRREAAALDLADADSSSSSPLSLLWADECSPLPREPGASDGTVAGGESGGILSFLRPRRQRRRGRREQRQLLCRPLLPFAAKLECKHAGVSASGWWTTTGVVLREPAAAAFDMTPQLVRGVLSKINPLLAGAIKLREDDAVRVSLWPTDDGGGAGGSGAGGSGHLPASAVRIGVRPLRLQMEPTALVSGSLRLVSGYNRAARALGGGGGGRGGTRKGEAAADERPTSPSLLSSFLSRLRRDDGSKRTNRNDGGPARPLLKPEAKLEAWTSSLSATLRGGGPGSKGFYVDSGRLDVLAWRSSSASDRDRGPSFPGTAHLAAWGTASLLPETGAVVRARGRARASRERKRKREGERRRREKEERRREKEERRRERVEQRKRSASVGGDGVCGPPSSPSSDASDGGSDDDEEEEDDPATSGLRMTLALMSDSLGLPGHPPWPAVRMSVGGTAIEPDVEWLSAVSDAAALLLFGRRRRREEQQLGDDVVGSKRHPPIPAPVTGLGDGFGSSVGGDSGFGRSSSASAAAGKLPWESALQRSGGSRREETTGAPTGPSVVGRLDRSRGSKLRSRHRR